MVELEHVSQITASIVCGIVIDMMSQHILWCLSNQSMKLDGVDALLIPPACDNIRAVI